MDDKFVSITGCSYYQGTNAINVGDKLCIVKDKDNPHDSKAIAVCQFTECFQGPRTKLHARLGYIAQSSNTIVEGTLSATQIYDSIRDCGKIEVMFKGNYAIIAKIIPYF